MDTDTIQPSFATIEDLKAWMRRDLSRWGAFETHVQELPPAPHAIDRDQGWRCRIFTTDHWYTIYASGPFLQKQAVGIPQKRTDITVDEIEGMIENDAKHIDIRPDGAVFISNAEMKLGPGHLGCTSSSRRPRAGEDWHRGSDLADGPLNEDTWRRILADIVSYEMVKIHVPKEPRGVPPSSKPG